MKKKWIIFILICTISALTSNIKAQSAEGDYIDILGDVLDDCACQHGGYKEYNELISNLLGLVSDQLKHGNDNSTGNNDTQTDNSYNDSNNDDVYAQENSGNGEPSNNSSLTEEQRNQDLNVLVVNFNALIMSKYGPNSVSLPTVTYDPNYPLTGFALFLNGQISISPKFFDVLDNDGDRMSTLNHEYTHYIQDLNHKYIFPKLQGGIVKYIPNVNLPLDQTELNLKLQINRANNNSLPLASRQSEATLVADSQRELTDDFTYRSSNYYRSEYEAVNAELQGEKDGLYTLSNTYRERRNEKLLMLSVAILRALRYELLKGVNPENY